MVLAAWRNSRTKTSLSFKSEILLSNIRVTLRRASLSLLSFSLLCLGLCTVCVCRAAAWQRSNSCSHRGLVSSVWREKQRGVFDRVGSGDHSHNGGKKGILSHVPVSFKPPWCYVTARRAYGCYVSTHVRICFCWHVNQCVWDHDKRIKSSQRIVCVCIDAIVWFLHFSWRCLRTISHSCWIFFSRIKGLSTTWGQSPQNQRCTLLPHTRTHTHHTFLISYINHSHPPLAPCLPPPPPLCPQDKI